MSESQLNALLLYESPPETPSQMIHVALTNELTNKNEVESETLNNFLFTNREQFASQMGSQIDFSIFHNGTKHDENMSPSFSLSSLKTQTGNESALIFSEAADHITLSSCEIFNQTNIVFGEEEQNFENQSHNSGEKNEQQNLEVEKFTPKIKPNNFDKKSDNRSLLELDAILKNIDFESISKLRNHSNNSEPGFNHKQCHSQLGSKSCFKKDENIIHSCPAPIQKLNSLERSTVNTTVLPAREDNHSYDMQFLECGEENFIHMQMSSFNEETSAKTMDEIDAILNNIDFESISNAEKIFNNKNINYQCEYENERYHDNCIFAPDRCTSHSSKDSQLSNSCVSRKLFSHGGTFDNIRPVTTTIPSKENFSNKEKNDASLIPFSVKQLYDIVKADYSDFAFIYALSAQLCQDRVPMECFVTLKMALLLSLVSIGNDPDRPPVPIVAMANDTYMTNYIMINIGKLATRFVGPMDDIKSTSASQNWIEADPILLAQGGVYFAGDWSRLKPKKAEHIFKTIECSNVVVENSTLSYPLESAIWTHWRSFKYNSKDQQTFNKFLKIFGIPIFVSDDNHETLVDYTLEQTSIRVFESTIDHLSINEDDMRKFLVYISQCNVDLTAEAAHLLKNYFVASRSARQDCFTKQSYTTLKQFAESFSKLSMRNEVLVEDVIAAIILCEHSIENIFNSTNNSPPHFGTFPFVGAVDEYFVEFKQWLDSFLKDYINI